MKQIFKGGLVVLSLLLSTSLAWTQTLHLFVIGDASDSRLGAVADFQKMQTNVENFGKSAKMEFKSYCYWNKNLSYETFSSLLDNFSCGTEDVVWFYYTGHGHNGENSRFNAFALRDASNEEVSCSMDVIFSRLQAKNPRLVLMMFDACNYQAGAAQAYASRTENPITKDLQFARLFKYAKGYVKVASNTAGANNLSFGNARDGGIFTNRFLQVFYNATEELLTNADWEKIMEVAKQTTTTAAKAVDRTQTPDYEVNVTYSVPDLRSTPKPKPKKTMK
jgi:hypothetical protein